MGLKDGDVMIDIGAGSGYFSIPASEIVGDNGRVIGVDNSKEMIEELSSRVDKSGSRNIEIVLSKEYDLAVKESRGDFVFISTVLHEVEDKILFLKEVKKVMKPKGKLAIVEWIKKPMEKGPPIQDRIDSSESADLLLKIGFHEIHSKEYNDYFYFVTAVK